MASLGLVSALVSPEAEHKNIVIIGAGSAGLATSYFLTQAGVSHIILERGDVANTWDNERWDGFHLVNPNWAIRLPGFHYSGDNPDGYLSKQETVDYLRNYARSFNAPVRSGVSVVRLSRTDESYVLELAGDRQINANCVVVATGAFGIPKTPEFAANLDSSITQLHSNDYVNHERLPEGGVLVVGSGQSGAQIAEELQAAGKKVYLSVGAAGRRPRRYRGKDSSWWNYTMGQFDKTIEDVDSIDDA
ncbi:MAG: NAD(P)-binding domain-containing protein, partial [Dehalococcoidia bacterium]